MKQYDIIISHLLDLNLFAISLFFYLSPTLKGPMSDSSTTFLVYNLTGVSLGIKSSLLPVSESSSLFFGVLNSILGGLTGGNCFVLCPLSGSSGMEDSPVPLLFPLFPVLNPVFFFIYDSFFFFSLDDWIMLLFLEEYMND